MIPLTMANVPLKYRQSEDEATLREAVLLVPLVEEAAAGWLLTWLRDGIETAGTPQELGAAWRRVLRYGHSVPREELARAVRIRARGLRRYAAQVRAGKAVVW